MGWTRWRLPLETTARRRAALFASLGALTIMPAGAQAPAQTLVRVTVRDSTGAPVPSAGITVLRGLRDTVATTTTDAAGARSLFVPRDGPPIQVVARKIGYVRAELFAVVAGRDSVRAAVTMRRAVTQLATVRITEREDAVRRSYFVDADDIAASARPIRDASDVLIKLRPDMIFSRAGQRGPCGTISNIWVNGKAVFKAFRRVGSAGVGRPARGQVLDPPYPISDMARSRAVPGSPAGAIGAARLTVLETIRPEHVAEMSYKDCFDKSMRGNFVQNALFIVLKPGIAYQAGHGSYPIESPRKAP